jgi:hypothetical protein
MRRLSGFARALAMIGMVAAGNGAVAGSGIRLGEGLGPIQAFDPARSTVAIGNEHVRVLPEAAASLHEQLVQLGLVGKAFSAHYYVVSDGAGPAIQTISVFPPRPY